MLPNTLMWERWRALSYWRCSMSAWEPKQTIAREAGRSPAHLHMSDLAWGTQKNLLYMFWFTGELRWAVVSHNRMSVFLAEPDADKKKTFTHVASGKVQLCFQSARQPAPVHFDLQQNAIEEKKRHRRQSGTVSDQNQMCQIKSLNYRKW